MEFEGRKKVSPHLDIAPLIDVVFLLLIFFMLTANFIMQPGLKITLPTAHTAEVQPEEDIVILISKDNNIYLNNKKVILDDLLSQLRGKVQKSKRKMVVIKADKEVPLGVVVRIMDMAKEVKARGLTIATRITD